MCFVVTVVVIDGFISLFFLFRSVVDFLLLNLYSCSPHQSPLATVRELKLIGDLYVAKDEYWFDMLLSNFFACIIHWNGSDHFVCAHTHMRNAYWHTRKQTHSITVNGSGSISQFSYVVNYLYIQNAHRIHSLTHTNRRIGKFSIALNKWENNSVVCLFVCVIRPFK